MDMVVGVVALTAGSGDAGRSDGGSGSGCGYGGGGGGGGDGNNGCGCGSGVGGERLVFVVVSGDCHFIFKEIKCMDDKKIMSFQNLMRST